MRRSRSSSIVRSTARTKGEVIKSYADTIYTILLYLSDSTNNIDAIRAISGYANDRIRVIGFFGSELQYDANDFPLADTFVHIYLVKRNIASNTNQLPALDAAKRTTRCKIDHYIQLVKDILDSAIPAAVEFFEIYIRNRMVDTLAFHGSSVLYRDGQTAALIINFNIA